MHIWFSYQASHVILGLELINKSFVRQEIILLTDVSTIASTHYDNVERYACLSNTFGSLNCRIESNLQTSLVSSSGYFLAKYSLN